MLEVRLPAGQGRLSALRAVVGLRSARRAEIVVAASDVFLRYGYARTTMGDIAEQARISRPALYLIFPNKDNVFAAVTERMVEDKLREYRLPRLRSLDRKLLFCCQDWVGDGYALTNAHPDARDVFDFAREPVRAMYAKLGAFLGELIAEAVHDSKLKTSPEELARVLIFSMRGVKDIARDAADMRRLIALQVEIVLSALRAR